MAKGIKRKIAIARKNVEQEIRGTIDSRQSFFARGLSSEGFNGGYRASNIYLCLDCGQFMIRGMMNGEYYSIDFTLVRDEHLEAAGKAVKYYSQED